MLLTQTSLNPSLDVPYGQAKLTPPIVRAVAQKIYFRQKY